MSIAFSDEEYADMHSVYGFSDGNTNAAIEEYRLFVYSLFNDAFSVSQTI
jgi:hypothetical protein